MANTGFSADPTGATGTGVGVAPEAGYEGPPEPPTLQQGPPATLGRARAFRNRRRTGAWPAGGVPRVQADSLEAVGDDVAYWIESTAKDVASAMMDGPYAPFAARVSPSEQARYYGETLFDPSGHLNPDRWWVEYQRVGPEGLAQAINGGARWRRQHGLAVILPQSQFQPIGEQMTPVTPANPEMPDEPGPHPVSPPAVPYG